MATNGVVVGGGGGGGVILYFAFALKIDILSVIYIFIFNYTAFW